MSWGVGSPPRCLLLIACDKGSQRRRIPGQKPGSPSTERAPEISQAKSEKPTKTTPNSLRMSLGRDSLLHSPPYTHTQREKEPRNLPMPRV